MRWKLRGTYAILVCILLAVEVGIALFITDRFVRPYVGDMLVTILLCCFCRMVMPTGVKALPAYVFLFAAAVEIGQYFDLVKRLGLEENPFLSVIMGRTFSMWDIVCYFVGCLVFYLAERVLKK